MTERAQQLYITADGQLEKLSDLISTLNESTLRLPCTGREKLGDGTVGASARHTADNYQRIAEFVSTSDRLSRSSDSTPNGGHRIPRFLRAAGHRPPDHAQDGSGEDQYTVDKVDIGAMLGQLADARTTLARIAGLTDSQLNAIPPAGSFRFCDGQRTLEQVLAGLLKHQGNQVEALTAAIAEAPSAA
jgi:hypothetical protein